MRVFQDLAAFEQAVGTHIGSSDWCEITQDRINTFADATGDHQWIHVDAERAAAGPFGATIAHGYLTLSMMSQFFEEIFRIEGLSMGVNYGCNKVRFVAPVVVGTHVRASVDLVSLRPAGTGLLATTRASVEQRGHEKPACVAEILSLLVA